MVSKFFEICFGLIVSIILPAKLFIILVVCIVGLDTLMRLITLKKSKEKFNFIKLTGGFLSKVFVYQLIIIAGYHLDDLLINEIVQKFVDISHLSIRLFTIIILSKEIKSIMKKYNLFFGKDIKDEAVDTYNFILDIKERILTLFNKNA